MGALNLQAIFTAATLIQGGEPSYQEGNTLESVERLSAGVYQLTFSSALNALEQSPRLTPLGTDPTADEQVEIVGGGPLFTQLNLRLNIGGVPTDVDCYFYMEQIRIQNTPS